jgi:hypothetical protein
MLILSQFLWATCAKSKPIWQNQIAKSSSIEAFFRDNFSCQKSFYKHLSTVQKIYFDTVLYPNNFGQKAYENRWNAMLLDDKDFFKEFTFFNNY